MHLIFAHMHHLGTDLRKFGHRRERDASREIVRVNILRHGIRNANLVIFIGMLKRLTVVRVGTRARGGVWEFAFVIDPAPPLCVLI